ncbi:hypothetical protein SEPCBS57363_003858 [Sporothrix epigloea]|uniref:tetrahydrofolate synthase n=1 Tax=Sporothrix epigloea TaxID=1892477 RepID=A0ABP0DQ65_9PEZI
MASLSTGVRYDTSKAVDFHNLPRTYANALHLLSLLPTNRDVTSLFEVPRPKVRSRDAVDLNSRAIPEMIDWMARAGYKNLARDLAPLRCIHISGTKGKGSVSAFATAILVEEAAAGNPFIGRIGTYLSPHVVSVRERIWLDGQPISRDLFTKYVFEMWARLSETAASADPPDEDPYGAHTKPFYFRFLTLLAYHVFLREGVRSAVIECGIGAEYDATNVLPASSVTASVVTRLGIDHTAMLGRKLSQIAWNKAGVFKPGVAAFILAPGAAEKKTDNTQTHPGESRRDQEDATDMLRTRAIQKNASAFYEISPQNVLHWDGVPGAALPGTFQKCNMALAIAAAEHHIQTLSHNYGPALFDPNDVPANVTKALAKATLRGRCESVIDKTFTDSKITYLVDGAHTADSLGEVAKYFVSQSDSNGSSHRVLLFSVRDREPGELVKALVAGVGVGIAAHSPATNYDAYFEHAVFVFPPEAEAAKEALLAIQQASPATKSYVCHSVPAAINQIRALAAASQGPDAGVSTEIPQRCQVLATGSFILVRDVLRELDADFEE